LAALICWTAFYSFGATWDFRSLRGDAKANHGGSHIPAPRTSSRSLRHILPDREKINRYIGAGQDGKAAKVQLQSLLILEVLAIYLQKALAVFPGGVDR